jgi:hypothetical protein
MKYLLYWLSILLIVFKTPQYGTVWKHQLKFKQKYLTIEFNDEALLGV